MKTQVNLAFLAVALMSILLTCRGFIIFDVLKIEMTPLGTEEKYCVFRDPQTGVELEVYPGSKFKTRTCLACTCTEKGLECFGPGLIGPPPGCEVTMDACEQVLVSSNDPTKLCET